MFHFRFILPLEIRDGLLPASSSPVLWAGHFCGPDPGSNILISFHLGGQHCDERNNSITQPTRTAGPSEISSSGSERANKTTYGNHLPLPPFPIPHAPPPGWVDALRRFDSGRSAGGTWPGCRTPPSNTNGGCDCGSYPRKASRSRRQGIHPRGLILRM